MNARPSVALARRHGRRDALQSMLFFAVLAVGIVGMLALSLHATEPRHLVLAATALALLLVKLP